MKCNLGYKMNSAKTACANIGGDYRMSSSGKCPKNFNFLTSSAKECELAAKALGSKDRDGKATSSSSTYLPRGCSYNTYHYL